LQIDVDDVLEEEEAMMR